MIFAHFLLEVNEANAFVYACESTREALLVDAGACDPRIAPFLEAHGLRLRTVLITHDHWDHVDGLPEVIDRFQPEEVYSFKGAVAGCSTRVLQQGDAFTLGETSARIVHTPGHTPDGITAIFPGVAFSGDALFSGSVGGTATDADKQRQLDAIREHIFSLPDDTEVHVGHGPSSTVGIEKRYNPFFV